MGKAAAKRSRTKPNGMTVADKVIEGLQEVLAALEAGGMDEVERRFKVSKVRVPQFDRTPPTPAEVTATREAVGVGPIVFASLLGVSEASLRAWEAGTSKPSATAARFLAEIRRDPKYWADRVRAAG